MDHGRCIIGWIVESGADAMSDHELRDAVMRAYDNGHYTSWDPQS